MCRRMRKRESTDYALKSVLSHMSRKLVVPYSLSRLGNVSPCFYAEETRNAMLINRIREPKILSRLFPPTRHADLRLRVYFERYPARVAQGTYEYSVLIILYQRE